MGQEGRIRSGSIEMLHPSQHPGEHGIAGGHRRQRDEAPTGAHPAGQHLRSGQSQFRLTLTHRRFDDEKARICDAGGQLHSGKLDRTQNSVDRKIKPALEQLLDPWNVTRLPRGRQTNFAPGRRRAAGRGPFIDVGEQGGIAGNPIRDDHRRGEKYLSGRRQRTGPPLRKVFPGPGDVRREFGQLPLNDNPSLRPEKMRSIRHPNRLTRRSHTVVTTRHNRVRVSNAGMKLHILHQPTPQQNMRCD